ncbi:MAG: restriction endonuclease subunit S [Pseudomonadales bacterium]|nr:restriction endonuclease subunit S [Pseudomonadales bacterium]
MSWPVVKLHDICRPKQWKTIAASNLLESGYPVYGANGKIGFYSEFTHESPTLMITCRGATCGNVHISEPKSYINGNAMALDDIDSSAVDLKYLYYFFLKRGFDDVISGSAQPQITGQGLTKVEIPLPPLAEQKRIATILNKADAIRRKRQQAIQLADEFLRAVFLDMFGDPVTNPKGFPLGIIRDLVESANYGSSAKASEAGGDYPILRMGNITYEGAIDMTDLKYIDLTDKEKPKYLAVKGDLLFNRTNSKELVGKTAVYDRDDPVAIAGYLIRVRTNEKGNSHYISGYLNSAHGKATLQNMCKSIVGMANINAQEMQDIPVTIPPVSLQNRYRDIFVSTKEKLAAHQAALHANNELFNALSQKAFSGQLS